MRHLGGWGFFKPICVNCKSDIYFYELLFSIYISQLSLRVDAFVVFILFQLMLFPKWNLKCTIGFNSYFCFYLFFSLLILFYGFVVYNYFIYFWDVWSRVLKGFKIGECDTYIMFFILYFFNSCYMKIIGYQYNILFKIVKQYVCRVSILINLQKKI